MIRSLGYQVLAAVILGIFTGLFFGPLTTVLRPIADVFVMLLQMVVLPYICFSLIHGLGSITPEIGKRLFRSGWPFLTAIWALIFFLIYLINNLIPKPLVASISAVQPGKESELAKNFLTYLVPENPFYDLANNIVPGVAIFGIILGAALMHLEQKEPFLGLLERINQTIEKILKWIALISPIGAFAHLAIAFGTVRFEDLFKIEFYIVTIILVSLLVTFWILPLLITSLTPLTYRQVLTAIRYVCLLPFVTGLPTIALPFINVYMKRLSTSQEGVEKAFHSTSQTVMPIAYSFGQIGNCMILFFILFLSFYYRHPFTGAEESLLTLLTIPLSIGSAATSVNSVSFLINQLALPVNSIELFSETLTITLNFQVLMSVAGILTLIILALHSHYGLLQIKWKKLAGGLGGTLAALALCIFGAKLFIHLNDNYQKLYPSLSISDVIVDPVPVKMIPAGEARVLSDPTADPLSYILQSGVLRIGYDVRNMPYCYLNEKRELAGYDIAYAYQLARDLDCTLEFAPLDYGDIGSQLDKNDYDLGMCAIIMDEKRILTMDFTHPYTEQNNVLVVPLKKAKQFLSLAQAAQIADLKMGAIGEYIPLIARHFPNAKFVSAHDIDPGLTTGVVDAWVWSQIPAFIWCLSHPGYVAINYEGLMGKLYFSYPFRTGSTDLSSFLDNWLVLKEQSGFKAEMEKYWIKGEVVRQKEPRWSILQNVLHVGGSKRQ